MINFVEITKEKSFHFQKESCRRFLFLLTVHIHFHNIICVDNCEQNVC